MFSPVRTAMQPLSAAACSGVGVIAAVEEGADCWSFEIAAATKLAMKNTSDMAIMRSRSILDLLLVALTRTLGKSN
jgi:hypothetical protein